MKVLYVTGSSRCGSTVLGNILGELDGFFNGGEIRFLWSRALQGRRCGCGHPVIECPVWRLVLPLKGDEAEEIRALNQTQRTALRLVRTPAILRQARHRGLRLPDLARYVEAMTDLYQRLSRGTDSRVIVDSSKRPSNAAALRLVDGIESYVIHLVRDARGVAYSRLRPKANPDGAGQMPIVSPWRSAIDWTATNIAAEVVRRHWERDRTMFLRYEDFVWAPRETIRRIVDLLDERVEPDPFADASSVKLGPNHTVSGNPDRFHRGAVSLRADIEWLRRMRPLDRRLTTLLTFPLLVRYGYPLSLSRRVD